SVARQGRRTQAQRGSDRLCGAGATDFECRTRGWDAKGQQARESSVDSQLARLVTGEVRRRLWQGRDGAARLGTAEGTARRACHHTAPAVSFYHGGPAVSGAALRPESLRQTDAGMARGV